MGEVGVNEEGESEGEGGAGEGREERVASGEREGDAGGEGMQVDQNDQELSAMQVATTIEEAAAEAEVESAARAAVAAPGIESASDTAV